MNNYILFPNMSFGNNSDNIPFLPNNMNLLEEQEIEEKLFINK